MAMTDPLSDMLTRIRNANQAFKEKVDIPYSKIKLEVARILSEEGFVRNYKVVEEKGKPQVIRLALKYGDRKERILSDLQRVSTPGRRVYQDKFSIPRPRGGMGVAVVSTSKGVVTDKQARKMGVGGEVLCYIY
jgi:small subunit ribosomal protein S8